MSNIQVTIDRLVLRGVDALTGKAVVEGLKAELPRVFAARQRNAASAPQSRPAVNVGRVDITPGTFGGRKFGRQLARRIGKTL
ncbi:MAG: hypothetical protein WCC87_05975 [Candidatus Korobacteraceae bacterium]